MSDPKNWLDEEDLVTRERVKDLPWIGRPDEYRFDPARWKDTLNGPVRLAMVAKVSRTPRRPVILGVRKPLTQSDPSEWWEEEALRLGVPVQELREQIRLADEVLEEIFAEEDQLKNRGPSKG